MVMLKQVDLNYRTSKAIMKALVTGSSGFIGSHVFSRLTELGFIVSGIDTKVHPEFDVTTYKFHEKYDLIFHLAADASIPRSFENPVETHRNNVIAMLRILEYAKKTGAKVIFSSSSSVYGEPQIIPTPESSFLSPVSPYAFQKLICEEYCKFYWRFGVKSVALRYFNVFGEGQENANGGGDSSLALGIFLKQHKENKPFTVVGDGLQRRDFVYVKDVAEANLKVAEWLFEATQFEAFNVGSGINYSILEVTDMIDLKHPKTFLPPRPEPKVGLADISKIAPLWKPNTTLEMWIKSVVNK